MARFVAFLRGVNVCGRTVKKEVLHEVFTMLGFKNVETYKQSGNVIFDSESVDAEELRGQIETALVNSLGYAVPVFLRTLSELGEILEAAPFRNQKIDGSSFLVTFLHREPDNQPLQLPTIIPKSTAQVISQTKREIFSVTHGGGEGALPNSFLEKKLSMKATTRNLKVVAEIAKKTEK